MDVATSTCRSVFANLCIEIGGGVEAGAVERAWELLASHYSEAHRAYHTLQHIADLLALDDEWLIRGGEEESKVVRFAIFYHDVIYDPQSGTNEEDSAELWLREAVSLGVDDATRDSVARYILATKTHAAPEGAAPDRALDFFLDFDMSVLGRAQLSDYQTYTRQVRREWSHLSDEQWAAGRSSFLSATLAPSAHMEPKCVFITPEMRALLEGHAARNLAWELDSLQRQAADSPL